MAPLAHFFYAARSASELASDYKNGWAKIGWASCFFMPAEPARREAPIKTGSSPQATPELLIAHC